jgi:hypothetical protein
MERESRGRGVRSFVIGGVVGASAVAAAVRRGARRRRRRQTPAGLAAFESAPCYRELLDQDAGGVTRRRGDARPAGPSAD